MNKKLTQPSPEHIALVREWQRQYESGEMHAGYWRWEHNIKGTDYWEPITPFYFNGVFRYIPSHTHPHYAVYCEWKAHKASGAVDRGEYVLKARISGQSCEYHNTAQRVSWCVENTYTIEKTSLHPDNQKPKLKLIDFSNVPVGTMTTLGEIRAHKRKHGLAFVEDSLRCSWVSHDYSYLRIVPATKWTAIQDGESPPVCKGLAIEYRETRDIYIHGRRFRNHVVMNENMPLINAYRVIGLAEGYTDDPEKAVV